MVEMEVAAVERIAMLDPSLPVPVARPALDGSPIASAEVDGSTHLVRLLPLLPGRNATATELDAAAITRIGEVVARIGVALRGFFHPAAGRRIWWDQQHLPELARLAPPIEDPARRELLARMLARFDEHVVPALPRLRGQVIHNDVTLDNLLLDERAAGHRHHRLRRHGAHGARPRRPGHAAVARARPNRPLRGERGVPGGVRIGPPARCRRGGAAGRPACRADGADDPHLRLAHAAVPRQRVHPWLGGARLGAPRAAGRDRLRRGGVAHGGHRPSADPATSSVRRAAGPTPPRARQRARVALLPDAAAPRARRRRLDGGCRRTSLPRRVQQRPGRRPRAPAGRRRHCATGGDAEHEHALSPRARRGAGRAPGRDDARRPRYGPVRQLRLRGERPRLAPGHDRHRGRCGHRHRLELPRRDRCDRRLLRLRVAGRRAARRRRGLRRPGHVSRRVRRCGRPGFRRTRRGGRRGGAAGRLAADGRRRSSSTPPSPRTASSCPSRPWWPRSSRPREPPARSSSPTRSSRAMAAPASCGASRAGASRPTSSPSASRWATATRSPR